jgi:hypothetical protein
MISNKATQNETSQSRKAQRKQRRGLVNAVLIFGSLFLFGSAALVPVMAQNRATTGFAQPEPAMSRESQLAISQIEDWIKQLPE